MSVELVLEMTSRETAQTVFNALDAYKSKLRASIQRTRRNLKDFRAALWRHDDRLSSGDGG